MSFQHQSASCLTDNLFTVSLSLLLVPPHSVQEALISHALGHMHICFYKSPETAILYLVIISAFGFVQLPHVLCQIPLLDAFQVKKSKQASKQKQHLLPLQRSDRVYPSFTLFGIHCRHGDKEL